MWLFKSFYMKHYNYEMLEFSQQYVNMRFSSMQYFTLYIIIS